ncbi:hypothetical protein KEM52_005495, partial [Ascosphaera acerosa]
IPLDSSSDPPATMTAPQTAASGPRDPNTLSNYHQLRINHTTANLEIVFEKQQLVGSVVHTLVSKDSAADKVVLDTSYLDVKTVTVDGQQSANWTLAPRQEPFGSALKIRLPAPVEEGKTVEVEVRLPPRDHPRG